MVTILLVKLATPEKGGVVVSICLAWALANLHFARVFLLVVFSI